MNARAQEVSGDHFIDDLPNDDYHKSARGLSTSVLKNFMDDPASVVWSRHADQDTTKLAAADFGTDFHTYFLEPERFKETHRVLPEFNRRKADERQAEQDMIAQWKADGIVASTPEDMAKLEAMRQSAMAHPTVVAMMSLEGVAERSVFWTDPKTGVECKCRPDWFAPGARGTDIPVMKGFDMLTVDIKTIADISRIQAQVENLRYFIQEPFYTRGIEQVFGGKNRFVFAFVSTSLSLGRYPVRVVVLDEAAVFDGRKEIDTALSDYAAMTARDSSAWQTAVTVDRPSWATREEDIY